jgi:hypothetical protein
MFAAITGVSIEETFSGMRIFISELCMRPPRSLIDSDAAKLIRNPVDIQLYGSRTMIRITASAIPDA